MIIGVFNNSNHLSPTKAQLPAYHLESHGNIQPNESMRKVLYLCPTSGIGGAETFLRQVHTHTDQNQFENHYLLFRPGPLGEFIGDSRRVHLLENPPRLSKLPDHKRVVQYIGKLQEKIPFNLIHSTMAYGAIFGGQAAKKLKLPHIWFQHGPASGWMDRVAALLPHATVIVNSDHTARVQSQLEAPVRWLVRRQKPMEKLALGTDITKPPETEVAEFRQKLFAQYNLAADTLVLSMVCRIQSLKGAHIFLQAMEILKNKNLPTPFHGFIWGEAFKGQDYFSGLERHIKKAQLPVSLPGPATGEIPLCLASSDILINASIQPEGFGLTIIEGMMVGAVPVVPNEGGPVEIVSPGENGLIFEARNPAALAEKLMLLFSDKDLRERLSKAAIKTAREKFQAQRTIEDLEEFYKKILGNELS